MSSESTGATTDTIRPRRGGVALPALASGLGLALSLPPWGFWILAFPAAGLLWWRLGGLRPRTRLWAGWLAGLGTFVPGLLFTRSFTLVGAAVLIALQALFIGVACLAVPRGPLVARALAFPAAMTLAEAARQGWPFGGLPIGGVFLGQAGGPLLGVARIGGPLGLTLVVYMGGVGLAALAMTAVQSVHHLTRATRFRELIVTSAIAFVALLGTGVSGAHAPDGGPSLDTVAAVAVQGGGVRGFNKSQVDPSVVLAAAIAATEPLTRRGPGNRPQLVLWPEDVVSLVGPLEGSAEEAVLSRLAIALHATLVVGITETLSETAFRNEVVAFGPDGSVAGRYEKVHRVPFGDASRDCRREEGAGSCRRPAPS